jgi:hypothetical protein
MNFRNERLVLPDLPLQIPFWIQLNDSYSHVFEHVNLIPVFCRTHSDIQETTCQYNVGQRTAVYNDELNAMYLTGCRILTYRVKRLFHFGNYFFQ